MLQSSAHGVCCKHRIKTGWLYDSTGDYADNLNRAYGDANGLICRDRECANVFEHNLLHDRVHDARHRERVNVRERSFREYDDVRVRKPKIGHLFKIARLNNPE